MALMASSAMMQSERDGLRARANHEIKNELDSVLDTIYAAVEERKSHLGLRDGAEGAGG
ncbi:MULTISPECIES: hypothetical protein [unclassified Mesorhizobium]|uniref:hypothetical protein n=1 Tax=unclassified Mesorhizobium TaxID=325217 RepID=UPI0018D2C4FB|nr:MULTISPECIES: hypothetical protein [unclassified Mesorhizobium]